MWFRRWAQWPERPGSRDLASKFISKFLALTGFQAAVLSVPAASVIVNRKAGTRRREVNSMLAAASGPGPEEDGPQENGRTRDERQAQPDPGRDPEVAGSPGLDWQALLEALAASGRLDGDPAEQDAELAEELAA
jgi:hypothetical protein